MRHSRIVPSDEEIRVAAKARGEDPREVLAERQKQREAVQAEYDRGGGDEFHKRMRAKMEARKAAGEFKLLDAPEPVSDFPIYKAPEKPEPKKKSNGRTSR